MNTRRFRPSHALCAMLLGAATSVGAAPLPSSSTQACASDAEVVALRARVAELEARLAASAAPMSAASTPAPLAALTPGGPVTPAATAPAVIPASMLAALPAARTIITRDGTAIRVIPLAPENEEPFNHAGCSLGFFKGSPPGRWKDPTNWDEMARGLTPGDVEALLGVEHHNVGRGPRQLWEYGKCGIITAGSVLFVDGHVDGWRVPEGLR